MERYKKYSNNLTYLFSYYTNMALSRKIFILKYSEKFRD